MIVLVAAFLSLSAPSVFGVGPYVDASRLPDFLAASRRAGLEGSIARAESRGYGASVFDLVGSFPVRSSLLLQLETSFVAVENENGVVEGFGDVLVWSRIEAWKGRKRTLFVTSSVRIGTGATAYFPYATGSSDVGLGVAFADSLGLGEDRGASEPPRYFAYWLAAGGAYVVRLDDRLEGNELHGNTLSAGGGVLLGATRDLVVEAGALGMVFDSGAVRELYFSRLTVRLSSSVDLRLTVQGERGDWRERAADAAVGAGFAVRY